METVEQQSRWWGWDMLLYYSNNQHEYNRNKEMALKTKLTK